MNIVAKSKIGTYINNIPYLKSGVQMIFLNVSAVRSVYLLNAIVKKILFYVILNVIVVKHFQISK